MSWITELAKVYDNTIGWKNDDKPTPMFHTTNNASVTITLDGNGNFIKATVVEKKDNAQITVMPCTESCAARTNGADAYPLCDKFEYIAKEGEKHKRYVNLLKSWAESEFSIKKIKSVYHYISADTLSSDLKKSGIEQVSDFIRWEVQIPGDVNSCLWKDENVYKSWIEFYNSEAFNEYCRTFLDEKEQEKKVRKVGLSYIDGADTKIAAYHPAKIRNAGSSAKIVSSNDTSNYTFRGRFVTDNEACQISSDVTQKAHSALRWLLRRQGVSLGDGLSIVTWNAAGTELPPVTASSTDLLPIVVAEAEKEVETNKKDNNILEFDFGDIEESEKEPVEEKGIYQTSREFAEAMKKRLLGYYGDISKPQNIMVMALKEATPGQGRISIILYRELQNSDMIESLENWYKRLSWDATYWVNKKGERGKVAHTIGTPSPKTIAECAYGDRVKPQLIEKTVQRILPCILDGSAIPPDLETQCAKSASNLLVVEGYKRDIVLETACAVFKYNRIIKNKEEYTLALEENRTSRDYLYGRLLAIAQQYENAALQKAGESRETNAVRYMQQFAMKPASTWKNLYVDKLPPYRKRLEPGLREWFEKKIQNIVSLFNADEYVSDKPLSGEFLLGYHCQLKDFRKKSGDSDNVTNENMEE